MGVLTILPYFMYFGMAIFLKSFELKCNNEVNLTEGKNEKTETVIKDPEIMKVVEQKFLEFMGLKSKPDKKLKMKVKVPNEMWKLYYKWSDENYQEPLKNDVDTVRMVDQEGSVIFSSFSFLCYIFFT